MPQWNDVGPARAIAPGEFVCVDIDDVEVAVFNVDGEFYAIENMCTHDDAVLTEGQLEGDQILCPRHGAAFCLRTGQALTPPAYEDLTTLDVRIEDGVVQVAERE